jgi:hypothetical protein
VSAIFAALTPRHASLLFFIPRPALLLSACSDSIFRLSSITFCAARHCSFGLPAMKRMEAMPPWDDESVYMRLFGHSTDATRLSSTSLWAGGAGSRPAVGRCSYTTIFCPPPFSRRAAPSSPPDSRPYAQTQSCRRIVLQTHIFLGIG